MRPAPPRRSELWEDIQAQRRSPRSKARSKVPGFDTDPMTMQYTPQLTSAFFTKLPTEIRLMIYGYARPEPGKIHVESPEAIWENPGAKRGKRVKRNLQCRMHSCKSNYKASVEDWPGFSNGIRTYPQWSSISEEDGVNVVKQLVVCRQMYAEMIPPLLAETKLRFIDALATDLFFYRRPAFSLNHFRSVVFEIYYLQHVDWQKSKTSLQPHYERMLDRFAKFGRLQHLFINAARGSWNRSWSGRRVEIVDLVAPLAILASVPLIELLVPRDDVNVVCEKIKACGLKNVQVATCQLG